MNNGIEWIYVPMGSEMLQLELIYQEIAEFLPTAIIYGIPILFGIVWLLAALDCILQENRPLPESHNKHKAGEQQNESFRDRLSKVVTKLSQNENSAAA